MNLFEFELGGRVHEERMDCVLFGRVDFHLRRAFASSMEAIEEDERNPSMKKKKRKM